MHSEWAIRNSNRIKAEADFIGSEGEFSYINNLLVLLQLLEETMQIL